MFASRTIPKKARNENHARLDCPLVSTNAARRGPSAEPALPPTWKSDCAIPCCPPEAMRATREDSGVKHSGADTHERSRSDDSSVAGGQRQCQKAGQADAHAHSEGIRLRSAVGIETDERLKDGGGQLQREGDQAHLAEIEMEGVLEERIDRGDQ